MPTSVPVDTRMQQHLLMMTRGNDVCACMCGAVCAQRPCVLALTECSLRELDPVSYRVLHRIRLERLASISLDASDPEGYFLLTVLPPQPAAAGSSSGGGGGGGMSKQMVFSSPERDWLCRRIRRAYRARCGRRKLALEPWPASDQDAPPPRPQQLPGSAALHNHVSGVRGPATHDEEEEEEETQPPQGQPDLPPMCWSSSPESLGTPARDVRPPPPLPSDHETEQRRRQQQHERPHSELRAAGAADAFGRTPETDSSRWLVLPTPVHETSAMMPEMQPHPQQIPVYEEQISVASAAADDDAAAVATDTGHTSGTDEWSSNFAASPPMAEQHEWQGEQQAQSRQQQQQQQQQRAPEPEPVPADEPVADTAIVGTEEIDDDEQRQTAQREDDADEEEAGSTLLSTNSFSSFSSSSSSSPSYSVQTRLGAVQGGLPDLADSDDHDADMREGQLGSEAGCSLDLAEAFDSGAFEGQRGRQPQSSESSVDGAVISSSPAAAAATLAPLPPFPGDESVAFRRGCDDTVSREKAVRDLYRHELRHSKVIQIIFSVADAITERFDGASTTHAAGTAAQPLHYAFRTAPVILADLHDMSEECLSNLQQIGSPDMDLFGLTEIDIGRVLLDRRPYFQSYADNCLLLQQSAQALRWIQQQPDGSILAAFVEAQLSEHRPELQRLGFAGWRLEQLLQQEPLQ
jgi:hypothetical protein